MKILMHCLFIVHFINGECHYTTQGLYDGTQTLPVSLFIGDLCEDIDGKVGNCTKIQHCDHAAKTLQLGGRQKVCGFAVYDPLVCCSFESQKTDPPQKMMQFSTPKKSYKACFEFHEMVCPSTPAGIEKSKPMIADGKPARFGHFPYLALLGYGELHKKAHWSCVGSIISQRFVLTTAQCTSDGKTAVSFIRVGVVRRLDKIRLKRLHRVLRIYKHPGFHPPQYYNDIALLYTASKIIFNEVVRPACLYHLDEDEELEATITGWGDTSTSNGSSDFQQYAIVSRYSDEECQYRFSPKPRLHRLKYGFDTNTQMCYEIRKAYSDKCPPDSGGPLEVRNFQFPCLSTIVGVTSFGDKCGLKGQPAVYTRISAFLPWIERVVWPPFKSNIDVSY